MNIEIDKKENVTIISLTGKLDSNTSSDVQEKLLPLIVKDVKLILNMENCEYLSSAGLRVLMMIGKTLSKESGTGVLAGLNSELRDVMEMTGFGQVFKNYENVDSAFNAMRTI